MHTSSIVQQQTTQPKLKEFMYSYEFLRKSKKDALNADRRIAEQ